MPRLCWDHVSSYSWSVPGLPFALTQLTQLTLRRNAPLEVGQEPSSLQLEVASGITITDSVDEIADIDGSDDH